MRFEREMLEQIRRVENIQRNVKHSNDFGFSILREQNEFEQTNQTDQPNDSEIVFDNSSDIVKNFVSDIKSSVGSGANLTFGNITYNKSSREVRWEGTISGLNWTAHRNDNENGFYVQSEQPIIMTTNATKALNMLNNYMDVTWYGQIGDAIDNGSLEQNNNQNG